MRRSYNRLIALLTCIVMLFALCSTAVAEEYTGSAMGRNGDVNVSVVYEDGRIVSVTVGENQETPGVGDIAVAEMPGKIVEAQSLTVDVVSGATLTSTAILQATEAALVNAGVDVSLFKSTQAAAEIVDGEAEQTDIVIVGAGMAGLMAAYELRESYPDVSFIVVDKLDYVSGSVPTSGGAMAAISSSLHKASDSECTTQDFVDLFEFTSNQKVNESLVKNVYEKSDVVMNRVLDFGAPFGEAPQQASPYSEKVTAFWTDGGGAALGQFMNQLVKDEPFDLRLSTRAEELIVEDGKVVGVVVADKTTRHEIRAKAVLLATGGFGSNPDYMHEWLPQFADGWLSTNAGANGDGFTMTRQFGTKMLGGGSMGSLVAPDGSALINSFFMVNQEGERFIGEDQPKYVLQRACSEQSDLAAFLLADANYADMDTLNAKMEAGFVKQYDTLDALAADNGIDAEALLQTVADYNDKAAAGENIPAKEFELAGSLATPLTTAPYYVEKITLRTFGTLPGIEVDEACHVLDGEGNPVSGLYAAGELIAGNAFNRQYPGIGIGISWAANSGAYAARNIASGLE